MADDDKPSVKAKLPSAGQIRRQDFTPHGLGPKRPAVGGGTGKPSGLTAAQAKKRNRIMIAIAAVVVVTAASVGTYIATRPAPKVTVTGGVGREPIVKIPSDLKAPKETTAEVTVAGKGPKVAKGDYTFFNAALYDWKTKPFKKPKMIGNSTIKTNKPSPVQIGSGQTLPGLEKGLTGQRVGSRVVIQIAPADGFGAEGNPQYGIGKTDTLVFVADITGTFNKNSTATGPMRPVADPALPKVTDAGAGKAPNIVIPGVKPPTELKWQTLIEGSGPAVAKGQTLFMQYDLVLWRTGKVLQSSFGKDLLTKPIGVGQLIPGWDTTLVGRRIGSRILMTVPPKDGYGSKGSPPDIKGDDTLVFVADILAAVDTPQGAGG